MNDVIKERGGDSRDKTKTLIKNIEDINWKLGQAKKTIDEYSRLLREKDFTIKDLRENVQKKRELVQGLENEKVEVARLTKILRERDDTIECLEEKLRDAPPSGVKKGENQNIELSQESGVASRELTESLETKDREIKDLKMRLGETSSNLLETKSIQALQEALCETVRDEMRSSQCNCNLSQLPHRQIGSTLFFDMMTSPQTVQDGENCSFIIDKREDLQTGGEAENSECDVMKVQQEDQDEENKDPEIEEKSTAEPEIEPSLNLKDYKKGLLLTGDTKPHSEKLKELHGKWNRSLKGWVFSCKRKKKVEDFIDSVARKDLSNRRRDAKKVKRAPKLKFNEEMDVFVDSSYEFLFHPETKEAFAHMDDSEEIHDLDLQQIATLEKKGYTVMAKRERKKYMEDYLYKTKPLTEKLVGHPKLKGYLILEEYPYLFTPDKAAFCELEAEACSSLSSDGISWLKKHDFEVLSKRDRKREILKVEDVFDDFDDSSESDVDLDSESD